MILDRQEILRNWNIFRDPIVLHSSTEGQFLAFCQSKPMGLCGLFNSFFVLHHVLRIYYLRFCLPPNTLGSSRCSNINQQCDNGSSEQCRPARLPLIHTASPRIRWLCCPVCATFQRYAHHCSLPCVLCRS